MMPPKFRIRKELESLQIIRFVSWSIQHLEEILSRAVTD